MTTNLIDPEALENAAYASEQKEAYQLLTKGTAFRVGAGARIDSANTPNFFVEVTLTLTIQSQVSTARLQQALNCLKQLENRNYTLTHQNGSITCEASVSKQNLTNECHTILGLLEKQFS